MKRTALIGLAALALGFVTTSGSHAASTLCVGGQHCYSTLQAAVNAAHDGDTIRINSGTFAGGVTITSSVNLVGAGAKKTTISGGGPVLTIGTIFAATEPTVSIDGVTITGGATTSSPESQAFVGVENVIALGGGISIPPNADFSGGANVTVTNSIITGNKAAPTASVPFGPPCPGNVNCPFALAGGAGIDTWGALTLTNSAVTGNQLGGDASDADGAGIYGHGGPVTINNTLIAGNRAVATAPNGRFADSGGVFIEGGSLTMDSTLVSNNSVSLSTSLPDSVETNANSGGIHIAGDDDCVDPAACVAATIKNTIVTGNSVNASNTGGSATDFCGGICSDGIITLQGAVVGRNTVTAFSSTGDASGDSGGFGQGGPGTIQSSALVDNSVSSNAPNGTATAQAGGLSTGDVDITTTIDGSTISGNQVSAESKNGQAVMFGAGLSNGGLLKVTNTSVLRNTGHASAAVGSAHGGGIWNSSFGGGPPFGTLTLTYSIVSGNALTAHGGITPVGGGLYTDGPATLTGDHINGNTPDNCSGASC